MHIGIIGGIGPAATDFYYRRLIDTFARRGADLDATIVHADSRTLLDNLRRDDATAQIAIYQRLTERLERAGAECVVITSISGHFCVAPFRATCPLPIVDLLEEVRTVVAARGLKRIGILGTRTVMQSRFYGAITSAEVLPPPGDLLDDVHQAYVEMAAAAQVTDARRAVFDRACARLRNDEGAEAIMLGGTDLALAFDAATTPFALVDCAAIHVDAVVRRALGSS